MNPSENQTVPKWGVLYDERNVDFSPKIERIFVPKMYKKFYKRFTRTVYKSACRKSFKISDLPSGEVTERPKVQHWKCCVGETLPRVRIPPSPLAEEGIRATRESLSVCGIFIFDSSFSVLVLCWILFIDLDRLVHKLCRTEKRNKAGVTGNFVVSGCR